MKKVIFNKMFPYSPNGFDVIEYHVGEQEVSDECAKIAEDAGYLAKAKKAAPKNKSK